VDSATIAWAETQKQRAPIPAEKIIQADAVIQIEIPARYQYQTVKENAVKAPSSRLLNRMARKGWEYVGMSPHRDFWGDTTLTFRKQVG